MAHHIYTLIPPIGERKRERIARLGVHSLVFIPSCLVLAVDGWWNREISEGVFKQFRTMRLSGNISAWRWFVVRAGGGG